MERLAGCCTMKPGGSAANVAIMLAVNECPVRLFAQAGDDLAGRFLVESLKTYGLDTKNISLSTRAATGLTVSLTYPKDRMYITYPGTVATTRIQDLTDSYIEKQGHLHLASFFLQVSLQKDIGAILRKAKAAGMSTSLDPGGDTDKDWDISGLIDHLHCLDYFMPNSDEICAMTGEEDVYAALHAFPVEVSAVIVKTGARGAVTRYKGSYETHPAIPVNTVDSTCAGDCFDAGFLYGLYTGNSFREAVHKGLLFGAQAVSTLGLPYNTIDQYLKGLL
jgi:sugar/nucleoside kinase (ribokinase family)